MRLRPLQPPPRRGVSLIEVLIAMLVISAGLLGLASIQSTSLRDAGTARYRAIASTLAEELVSRMWLSDHATATLQSSFGSDSAGSGYTAWLAQVQSAGLPGVAEHPPTVNITSVSGGGSSGATSAQATVTVRWLAPGDSTAHAVTLTAQIP